MKADRGLGSGGSTGWFLQRITGVLLIPAVLAHIWVTHYILGDPGFRASEVSFANVAARLANPWWKLIDISFLFIVLFHGIRGGWNVLEEYVHNATWRVIFYCAVVILGLALAILGTVTILPFRVP
jgi:succinate dehydrogenase / fumarate reductase membrane anchor subunit